MDYPLTILCVGIAIVIGMIVVLRAHPFLAMITAAMAVSLLAPGEPGEKISRVAEAFGNSAAKIGIVIALAAVIGKCLMDSGGADRIVQSLLRLLGEKRTPEALAATAFVLSPPVFFNTAFYLMVPLARSFGRQTRKNYLLYILAIGAGGVVTHVLVPPAAGPVLIAANLHVDVGLLAIVGTLIGIPTALVGLAAARGLGRLMDIPVRPYPGEQVAAPSALDTLPGLWIALTPIALPVILISANTILQAAAARNASASLAGMNLQRWADISVVLGNVNVALLLSAAVAMFLLVRQRGLTLRQLAKASEDALMNAGAMILIIASGGAFGAMLVAARVGEPVRQFLAVEGHASGMALLWSGFALAVLLKTVQGSSTVAIITTSALLATMHPTSEALGYHPVYLAAAVGAGSLVFSWMNDSGFWVVARMSGLTEAETLKSWTVLVTVVGLAGMVFIALAAWLVPLT